MIGNELLFDTNALIAWMRADSEVLSAVPENSSPVVSLFTLGEMHFGIHNSERPSENEKALRDTLRHFQRLLPDEDTAVLYGLIFHKLRRRGRPIPVNDIWIAALARQHSLPILTRDAHFREVEALEIVSW